MLRKDFIFLYFWVHGILFQLFSRDKANKNPIIKSPEFYHNQTDLCFMLVLISDRVFKCTTLHWDVNEEKRKMIKPALKSTVAGWWLFQNLLTERKTLPKHIYTHLFMTHTCQRLQYWLSCVTACFTSLNTLSRTHTFTFIRPHSYTDWLAPYLTLIMSDSSGASFTFTYTLL